MAERRLDPELAVLALALTVRLAAMWIFEPTPSIADERGYLQAARHVLAVGTGWITDPALPVPFSSPPVVPTLYALVWSIAGPSERALKLLQVAVGALLVLPVMSLGRRLGGGAVAVVAGLLVALHPDLVTYSTRLWTEPVYTLLVFWALDLLTSDPSRRASLGVGALLGLAALSRESGLGLPLLAVIWALPAWRARWGRAGLVWAGFLLVLLPYLGRARLDARADGLIGRASAYNLYIGNVRGETPFQELGETPEARDEAATRRVWEVVRADPPGWAAHKASTSLRYFVDQTTLSTVQWTAPAPDPRRVRTRLDVLEQPEARASLAWSTRAAQSALWALGALGWALAPWRARREVAAVLLGLVFVTWLPTFVTISKARFALPCVPAILIGAAWLARGREAWAGWPRFVLGLGLAIGVGWLAW